MYLLNNDNIIGLNSKIEEKPVEPTYNYSIRMRDGQVEEATGYLVIGHDFYGVARGEGVLYNVWPKELIQSVSNFGPISLTVN